VQALVVTFQGLPQVAVSVQGLQLRRGKEVAEEESRKGSRAVEALQSKSKDS
jgi:hypothetical protein